MKKNYVIENGFEIPESRRDDSNSIINIFKLLEVGESFIIDTECSISNKNRIGARINYYQKAFKKRFCFRSTKEGIRVWRLE